MKKLMLLFLLPVLMSCGQLKSIDLHGWTVEIGLTLGGVEAALPTVRAIVDTDARLTAAQRAEADALITTIGTTDIPTAERDLNILGAVGGQQAQCVAHASIDLVAGDATALFATLDAVGITIPFVATAAVGGVAAVADTLLPGCQTDAGVPTASARLRMHVHSSGAAR